MRIRVRVSVAEKMGQRGYTGKGGKGNEGNEEIGLHIVQGYQERCEANNCIVFFPAQKQLFNDHTIKIN